MLTKTNWLIIFLFIVFSACNKKSDDDLFKTAMEDLKNRDTQEAIKNFEELVQKYPYSSFTAEALYQLGTIYSAEAADSVHKIKYYEKAIEYLQQLIDKFPNYEKTPEAIFLAGFINAEYLKNYEQAKFYYKKFMKAYPDHELYQSVRIEYENLGKSPEQILQEKGVELKTEVGAK